MPARSLDGPAFVEALSGVPKPFVLDIRGTAAYEAGHVPGSAHIEVYDLGSRRRDLPSSRVERILVVGHPGRRTDAGVRFLELMGFGDIAELEGGITSFPGELEAGPPPPPPPSGPLLRTID